MFITSYAALLTGSVLACLAQVSQTSSPTDLNSTVYTIQNKLNLLDIEVQKKNDETQILRERVDDLTVKLEEERNKTAELDRRVTALEKRLSDTVDKVKATESDLQTAVTDVTQLKTEIKNLTSQLLAFQSTATTQNNDVQQIINNLQQNLTIATNIALNASTAIQNYKPPEKTDVYFSYRNLADKDISINGSHHGPIVFTGDISTSSDHSYHSDGVFLAPFNGSYYFSTTLSADVTDYLRCYIVRNYKEYLVEVYISANNVLSSASSSVVVELSEGDVVAVTKCEGNATLSSFKSSFSGFLLNKLP